MKMTSSAETKTGMEKRAEIKAQYLFSSFQTKLIDEQFFEFVVDIFSL